MDTNAKVYINLEITVILVLAAILVIIDFYYIGSQLDGYPFDDITGGPLVINQNENVIDEIDVEYSDGLNDYVPELFTSEVID